MTNAKLLSFAGDQEINMKLTNSIVITIFTFLTAVGSSRIHRNPDVVNRIPQDVKESIDQIVNDKLQLTLSTHFVNDVAEPLIIAPNLSSDVKERRRRDADDNSTSGVFSEWSEFGDCTAKCGGGIQVRTRFCLIGNCTELGSAEESRSCGNLPCVAGMYVLNEISPFGYIPINGSNWLKFFDIKGLKYFGYITDTKLYILKWNPLQNTFEPHQEIVVNHGIAFDIMKTYPRTYLVVIEQAISVFKGRYSKMYYYDPFFTRFQTTHAVTFEVWKPSAVKTFDVFGVPFMAIVNFENKISEQYGIQPAALICNQQTSTIQCAPGTVLRIQDAFYGRVSEWECPLGATGMSTGFQYFAWCIIPGIKETVSNMCDDKQSCTLTADPSALTSYDSCVTTNKYLKVTYACERISYMGQPVFYKWDGIGLSVVSGDNLITQGPKDIEAFTIHNQQYVAVANYINDQQHHHLDSEIYIYNLHLGRFQSLQRLRTDGAVDWEFFKVGEGLAQEYFIAVANQVKVLPNGVKTYEVDSVIYKWNWNLFVPFQCIKTFGANKWTAISGINGEFVLSVTNVYGNTSFYAYDGWRFYLTKVQPKDEIFENAKSLSTYLQYDQPMFLVQKDYDTRPNLYQVNFLKTFPKYELLESTLAAVQELNRTVYEELIPDATAFNATYESVKNDVVFVDTEVFLTAHKTFREVEVISTTFVNTATVDLVNLSPSDEDRAERQRAVKSEVENQQQRLEYADTILNDVVTKSTSQIINATKTFENNVRIENVFVEGNLNVSGQTNGVDLSELRDRALYIDESATITGNLTFNDVILSDLFVNGLIDGLDTSDFITIDVDEIIAGKKTFSQANFVSANGVRNISVEGLINGVKLTDLLTLRGNQTILAPYTFKDSTIVNGNLLVREKVNNKDLKMEESNTVFLTQSSITLTDKTFQTVTIQNNLTMTAGKTINDVDISELEHKGTHLGTTEYFNSSLAFGSNVTFLSPVKVVGLVNGLNLSDVVYRNIPASIRGIKTFKGDITFHNKVDISGKLNGVDISGDVLDTLSDQEIKSSKRFLSYATINGDLNVTGLIDDTDVYASYHDTVLQSVDQTISGFNVIKDSSANSVVIKSCGDAECDYVNVLTNLRYNTVRESNTQLIVNGTKTFANGLTITGNLGVQGLVNGIILPSNLMLQGIDEVVNGTKTFNDVTLLGNVVVSQINNVNLTDIYEKAWRSSYVTTMSGKKHFIDEVHILGDLNVLGEIDGVDLATDVVLSNVKQNITGKKHFINEHYVKNLFVRRMETHGTIDGVNLTDLNDELIKLSGDIVVKGTKVFTNQVSFAGNWTIPGLLVDGVNITELNANAMRIYGDQTVTGKKTFTGTIETQDELSVDKLVDGVNLTRLAEFAVRLDDTNITFSEHMTFENVHATGNVHVDLINNHNLTRVVEDALLTSGNQVVTGNHFVKNLTVTDEVFSHAINGQNFSDEVVPLNQNLLISGEKVFTAGVSFNNVGAGDVNGIQLDKFSQNVLKSNSDATLKGHIRFDTDLRVLQNMTIEQLINGADFTSVASTTLFKTGDQIVTVPTHFKDVTFLSDVQNQNYLNGVNVTEFSENLFYKCHGTNTDVQGQFTFQNASLHQQIIADEISVSGNINGIDVSELNKAVVKLTGNHSINGQKYIQNSVHAVRITSPKINTYNFPADFVLIAGNETITGKKTFENNLYVLHDVPVAPTKKVDGIDLSEFNKIIVTKQGNQTISTPVQFQDIAVKTNLDVGLINGVRVTREHLVIKDGQQNITGAKTFKTIHTEKEISSGNHIQGYNLASMKQETVLSGQVNVIAGNKRIVGDVHIDGDLDTNYVDGANVTLLFSGFNKISNFLDRDLHHFNQTISTHQKIISQIGDSVSNIHQALDYFTDEEDIFVGYKSHSIDVFYDSGTTWTVAGPLVEVNGTSCMNFTIYSKTDGGNFTAHSQSLGNAVTDVKFHKTNEELFLVTTSDKENDGCVSTSYNSIVYKLTDKFNPVESFTTKDAKNFDVFSDDNGAYILINNKYGATCAGQQLFRNINSSDLVASLPFCNVFKSVILSVQNDTITIAMLSMEKRVDIYVVFLKNGTHYQKQTLSTGHTAEHLLKFTTSDGKYLAIANTYDSSSEALSVFFDVPVTFYKLDEDGFYEHFQDIHVGSAFQLEYFQIGIYDYVAVATYDQRIVILKFKGVSMWTIDLTVPIAGYGSIRDLVAWKSADEQFLSVLSDNPWTTGHPSKIRILKAQLTSTVEGHTLKQP